MNSVPASSSVSVVESLPPVGESAPATSPALRKPRVWTPFFTLLVAVLVGNLAMFAGFVALGLATGIVLAAQGADPAAIQARVQELIQQPLPLMLLTLLPFQLGMTVVVLFAAWRSPEPMKQRIGLTPTTGRTFGGFRLATMAAFTVSAALIIIIGSSMLLGAPPAETPADAVLAGGSWWAITLLSIVLSVIPAIVEEIMFRGYVQRRFLQRWSPGMAIGVTSLLFAVMHFDSLQHMIAVAPLAVVTGMLAYRTNSVVPGMLVHALHNAAAVGYGALMTALMPHFGQETVGLLAICGIGVLGLVGLPAVVSLLRSEKPRPADEPLIREFNQAAPLTDSQLAGQM